MDKKINYNDNNEHNIINIKKQQPITGFIIISILGISGILMVYFSGIFQVNSLNMLYDCIAENGIMIIFGIFFFIIFIYCCIFFFLNEVIKPKKEILYFYKNEKGERYFLNKKGKKIRYSSYKNNLEEGYHYYVLKTNDYICEIIEKTQASWIPKEKISYWLNFYSPIGNYEDLLLLPIVYVILLPGILSFLMSTGYQKIYGIIFSAVPIYIIIYDLIYKIKLNKSNNKEIDETNFIKSYDILKNTISIIVACVLIVILLNIYFTISDLTTKLIFTPFLYCGFCNVGYVLSKIFKNDQLATLFLKGYIIVFLIYWFGFLLFWTFSIIKQEENQLFALFSIPFWIVGFFVMYKYLIRNK